MKKWDELTDREQLEVQVYELHKDATGYRDRRGYDHLTDDELHEEFDYLLKVLRENQRLEAEAADRAVEEFKSQVELVKQAGARDFDTALRWLYNDGGDDWCHQTNVEHWVYDQGILYTDFGADVLARLEGMLRS
ncbi:MAG: hypothetical protein VW333_03610 [Pseudomonadales bacterium]